MKLSAFPQQFPTPQDPIVDPKTGALTPALGYKLLQALWNRTGGGDGIIPSIATGLVAEGGSQTTALVLTDDWNEVDKVALNTGVQIPPLSPGQMIAIFNGGANALNVFPFGGGSIDGAAINAAYVLGTAKRMQIFWVWTLTQIRSFGQLQSP